MVFLYEEIFDRINYLTYSHKQEILNDKKIYSFNVTSSEFMVAFKTETPELDDEFENYFEMRLENWTWDYKLSKWANLYYIKMVKCTPEHFKPDLGI